MIFRQLLEPVSSTYTYVLGCPDTGEAILIDPVVNSMDRDLQVLQGLGLRLAYTLDTHIHADHITAALELKKRTGSRIAAPAFDRLSCTDFGMEEARPLQVGSVSIDGVHTPGHTDGHFAYVVGGKVFTGDALLIDGCGRTDFQNGDSQALYHSVTQKLFSLAGETLVYPAHDYTGRHVSSIAQEKTRNPRLGGGKSLAEFQQIMATLNLPYPKFIDYAVPGNRGCGVCPNDLPHELQQYCAPMAQSPQG
ncbi:Zn-dependent hydrolase [Burkholderia cenocepacia]|uniref:MBL fold metallo-hydrolase n=1 Tax=Burkholderiaceae TaxID=119060 RepID=UPI000981D072|nr:MULTISPECIES: MBL fold metallo-hydrolase [Burkholderiaceae]ONN82205.1 Zn-dependent hydrolase [Burkholderia cenocepacia]ONN85931.1 Zn-dependent hydrolase [Burkholderia cenocepacia]ONO24299.1 Zn-dependent hydrolase [Burkholderia cenocepacia]ONO51671.1 Zn-dependent hydrolase [Burkholderia cenocepacia]